MMLPTVSDAALASRLGIPVDGRVTQCIEVAISMLAPRVDPALCAAHRGAWDESVLQLAVKVWDTGVKGTNSLDPVGDFDPTPALATAGLWRSVLGILQPCMPTGGVVVA